MKRYDVIIIGAGIVGLATAYHLSRAYPKKTLLVMEKEAGVGKHQTGHNSGVIHSGIYYKPGSLKALNCREGKKSLEEFCEKFGIRFKRCGKVIVATETAELERLQNLWERGQANGVDCEIIGPEKLREIEPHCVGLKAIHVRETGIVDYRKVCEQLVECLKDQGQEVITNAPVTGILESAAWVSVKSQAREFNSRYVVNCGGLYSDQVARLSGRDPQVRIVPFRGEYYEVKPEKAPLCRNLIYPVPDPGFPFLGVHFTRMVSGQVECGPNAVLAFAREGYRKFHLDAGEFARTLMYPGFLRMAFKYWAMGLGELWRSFSKAAFTKALQRLIPELRSADITPAPAGVRAQAVNRDGHLLDDFAFFETARIVNVINAPSPAATASLSIGKMVVEKLAKRFY